MNRTDRLLAILIELQRKQTVTAQSLAEKFETSIALFIEIWTHSANPAFPFFQCLVTAIH